MHRNEIAGDRERDREDAAGRDTAGDPGRQQELKIRSGRAGKAGDHQGAEADGHQPRLADHVGQRPEQRLQPRIGQRECGGEQRDRGRRRRKIVSDLRKHRVHGAHEQASGKIAERRDGEDAPHRGRRIVTAGWHIHRTAPFSLSAFGLVGERAISRSRQAAQRTGRQFRQGNARSAKPVNLTARWWWCKTPRFSRRVRRQRVPRPGR